MKWFHYLAVVLLIIIITTIITSIFWNAVLPKQNYNPESIRDEQSLCKLELEDLRYFCVMDYCETSQVESGYRMLKSLKQKQAEINLFCAELRLEFNDYCKPGYSNWGDFCYIRNERIEMFCI